MRDRGRKGGEKNRMDTVRLGGHRRSSDDREKAHRKPNTIAPQLFVSAAGDFYCPLPTVRPSMTFFTFLSRYWEEEEEGM